MVYVTTSATLESDLRSSLAAQKPIETLGDFFNALMASRKYTLDTPIASIEFGVSQFGNGRLEFEDAPDGLEIREGQR